MATGLAQDRPVDRTAEDREPMLRRHPWVFVITVLLPLAELAVLQAVNLPRSAPLAPHMSATAPFEVFHDLRWLLVWHDGWWWLLAGAAGAVVVRSLVTALIVRAAWPLDEEPPTLARAWTRAATYIVATMIVLAPWAALVIASGIVSLSWLWFAGLAPAILIAAVLHRGAIAGSWWRLPTWRTFLWAFLSALVLTLGSAAVAVSPSWWLRYVAAGLVGVFNAWAWISYTRVAVLAEFDRPIPGLAVVAVIGIIGLSVWGASAFFGGQAVKEQAGTPPTARGGGGGNGQPVLVVHGYGSRYTGQQPEVLTDAYDEVAFSYRGLGKNQQPLPYEPDDTNESVFVLADRMATQVRALHERTGRPVDIVADSEGSMVTQVYLARATDPPVTHAVLLSPLLQPAQAYYPPQQDSGWGVAEGWTMRGVIQAVNLVSSGRKVSIDSGFVRSIVDHGALMRQVETCPMADVDTRLVVPLAATSVAPYRLNPALPIRYRPAVHAGLLSENHVNNLVLLALQGKPWPTPGGWDEVAAGARALASGWGPPPLRASLPASWRADLGAAAAIPADCGAVRQALADAYPPTCPPPGPREATG